MLQTKPKTSDKFDSHFIELLGNAVMNSASTFPNLSELEFELQDMRGNRKLDNRNPELLMSVFSSPRANNTIVCGRPQHRLHTRDGLPTRFAKGMLEPPIPTTDVARKQTEETDSSDDKPG